MLLVLGSAVIVAFAVLTACTWRDSVVLSVGFRSSSGRLKGWGIEPADVLPGMIGGLISVEFCDELDREVFKLALLTVDAPSVPSIVRMVSKTSTAVVLASR